MFQQPIQLALWWLLLTGLLVQNLQLSPPLYPLDYFQDKSDFFLLEPEILRSKLSNDEWHNLKWRFKLQEFAFNPNSLTIGMIHENDNQTKSSLQNLVSQFSFSQMLPIKSVVRFSDKTGSKPKPMLTHLFLRLSLKFPELRIHVVVFHRVKKFFWLGQIPDRELAQLAELNLHFGLNWESIYDRFGVQVIDSIQYPDDIGHFLSQIPTSRYVHCPTERKKWLLQNNVTHRRDHINIESVRMAIGHMKTMMKQLQMEFWIVCGTLLGWYRQCHLTPYTDDTDFATWSRYLEVSASDLKVPSYFPDTPLSYHYWNIAKKHNFQLLKRLGDPDHSLEYNFIYDDGESLEKFDLFFVYHNDTHFKLPIHMPKSGTYAYLTYPPYQLCSVELLDYKLLAPCSPEQLIRLEYGPDWMVPVKRWLWFKSSFNTGPRIRFHSDQNIAQLHEFDIII